jgi:hypothetical protein
MSKERDRQAKEAPPRESDSARRNRFMTQTGLHAEGSAKMRRYKARVAKSHKQKSKNSHR